MIGQILVPLKKDHVVEEIAPYLDVFARPGMHLVFLVAYNQEVSWMDVQLTAIQTGIMPPAAAKAFQAAASCERQLRWVEQKIRLARETLIQKGLTVAVECYSGSLRNALASLHDSETETVVVYARPYKLVSRFIQRATKILSVLGAPIACPSSYCALAVNIELNGIDRRTP